jgi:hypothetical protein
MTTSDTHRPLPIDIDDFLRLQAATADRDRNLWLTLGHTEAEEDYIAVMIKGVEDDIFHIRHAVETEAAMPCWLVHHPSDGPMYEFRATSEIAAFLASGDARLCKRSWTTGRK